MSSKGGTYHFLRTDFNEDNRATEAGILSVLEVAEDKSKLVCGTYRGQSEDMTVELGFAPAAVIVMPHGDANAGDLQGLIATMAVAGSGTDHLTVTDNGFEVTKLLAQKDNNLNPYRYLALC